MVEFQTIRKQSILVMERAPGVDLEQVSLKNGPLHPKTIVKIAVQIGEVLLTLRNNIVQDSVKPLVHGDIKPSNLVWDEHTETAHLIDWGSSVFAQVDATGQYTANNVMDLMSGELHQTNARLGDAYYIGEEQLNGALSSPRFDEQGLASTLYALASGQSSRYGRKVITPLSLGLPKFFAEILHGLLDDDRAVREKAGDYFFKHLPLLKNLVLNETDEDTTVESVLPTWLATENKDIETVVYSSRKSFLRQEGAAIDDQLKYLNDAQFDRYYKNYMQGMGETEKGFIAAISRLGNYPVVGGIAIRWEKDGIYVDSSLFLHDHSLKPAFDHAVNTVISLARAIHRTGIFKCCLFNAKSTLHIERNNTEQPFKPKASQKISFETSSVSSAHIASHDANRMHSYFEDGDDPDELLKLPNDVLTVLTKLNNIHHTGCIIFEALPKHLKVHNYYRLLDHEAEQEFMDLLNQLVELIPQIDGQGISGFMKLPYKDTRIFSHQAQLPEKYYPKDSRSRHTRTN
jgi:non-specific serine/threonine protein kinase